MIFRAVALGLVNNIALLLVLALLYDLVLHFRRVSSRWLGLVYGVLAGLTAIAVMLNPFPFAEGIFFDSRSVLLSLTGLFFGPSAAIVATVVAVAFRMAQGGAGAWVGSAVILSSTLIGWLWGLWHRRRDSAPGHMSLALLGLAVHVAMMLWMLGLPDHAGPFVLRTVGLPIMILFPLATVLVGRLLSRQSENVRAADAVRRRDERFRKLVAQGGEIIALLDADGEKLLSAEGGRILGLSEDQIRHLSVPDMVHPQDYGLYQETVRSLAEAGSSSRCEMRFLAADGSYRWLQVRVSNLLDDPQIGALVVNALDVTERHEALARVVDLAEIIEGSLNEIYVIDQETLQFLYVNDAARSNIGYSRDKLREMAPYDIKPAYDEDRFRDLVRPLLNQEADILRFETEHARHDGTRYPVEVTLQRSRYGQHPAVAAIILDISDRKRAEQALQRLNEELEDRVRQRTAQLQASNDELRAFTHSVSHDLRAPLRAISGFGQMLSEDYGPQLDDEGRRLLDVISGSVERMNELINSLLGLSRSTRQEMVLDDCDMRALAEVAWHEVSAVKDLRASLSLGEIPRAVVDPALMRQVWINLLSNACKYSQPVEAPAIEVSGFRRDDCLVYRVRDNGVGFDPGYAHKLFAVFQRLHGSDEFEGVGVGLALVQRIISRHGGQVWAEGRPDEGASFFFSLPLRSLKSCGDLDSKADGGYLS